MGKKIKRFFVPGLGIAASAYCSWSFAAGAIAGFYIAETFMNRLVGTGRVKQLKLNYNQWEIHLHHWIWPSVTIIGFETMNYITTVPLFILGFLNGLIFHDIYTDKKWRTNEKSWYQVIYKK